MRQSLAGAAARGTSATATQLLAEGDIEGLMALHRSIFGSAVMGPDDDADDDNDDGDNGVDDDDNDDDSDDSDDDSDDGDKGKKTDARARRIEELNRENKKYRLRARDYRRERDEALNELDKLKNGKGKPKQKDDTDEDDSDNEETAKVKAENDELKGKLVAQQLRSEFNDLTSGTDAVAKFKNPKTAFRLLDLDDVEIDDEGNIEGLEDAIKELVKSDPYLVDTGKDDEDDDEDGARKRKTGQPTGSRKKGNPNRDKLVSKYPALRR